MKPRLTAALAIPAAVAFLPYLEKDELIEFENSDVAVVIDAIKHI